MSGNCWFPAACSVAVLFKSAIVAGTRGFIPSVLVMYVRNSEGLLCILAFGIKKAARRCLACHLFDTRCGDEVERTMLSLEGLEFPIPLVRQWVIENGCVVLVFVSHCMPVPERLVEFVGVQIFIQFSCPHCV